VKLSVSTGKSAAYVVGQNPGGFPNLLEVVFVVLEGSEPPLGVALVDVGEGVWEALVEFDNATTSQYMREVKGNARPSQGSF
jgi:hypothetical protein